MQHPNRDEILGRVTNTNTFINQSIIVWTSKTKSLLSSLYEREEFPLFGKEGSGEIFVEILSLNRRTTMPYDASLNFIFWCPTKLVFGENTALDVAMEVESLGCKRALIVTDKDLIKNTDIPERITKALGKLSVGFFSDVETDSGLNIVNQGAKLGKELGAD